MRSENLSQAFSVADADLLGALLAKAVLLLDSKQGKIDINVFNLIKCYYQSRVIARVSFVVFHFLYSTTNYSMIILSFPSYRH